jgi:hypothetical protein
MVRSEFGGAGESHAHCRKYMGGGSGESGVVGSND